jgi:tetratricopeptide (TPR) repeat protein
MRILADVYMWRDSAGKSSDFEIALSYLDRMRELKIARLIEAGEASPDPASVDWLDWGVPFAFRVGELRLRQGDVDGAIDAYERSLELAPDHSNSYYRLGVAYDEKGEKKKATANLGRYIGVTSSTRTTPRPWGAKKAAPQRRCATRSLAPSHWRTRSKGSLDSDEG